MTKNSGGNHHGGHHTPPPPENPGHHGDLLGDQMAAQQGNVISPFDMAWDIFGGPGVRPVKPNEADYLPGGKWYGFMSYSAAMNHYAHAQDAYQNGYWYHGAGSNYSQQQLNFNNRYISNGGVTHFGVHTDTHSGGNAWQPDFGYQWDGTQWRQVSTGSDAGGDNSHQPENPGGNNGGGGSGSGGGSTGGSGGAGGSGGSGGSGSGGNGSGMSGAQQGAFDAMRSMLDQYGLGDLTDFLQGLILDGVTDAASLQLQLQGTDTWKRRFAGNEMLRQKGLGVLSPGEYLSMEKQYAQIMRNYGLPSGFYDQPQDFAHWIGNNVSVNELQQRVAAFSDLAVREDPAIKDQLTSMGMGHGELLAYMMDPDRAAPLLQQAYKTTILGAASRRAGYVADNHYLEQLAARGVSEQEAAQGFGLIAGSLADANELSQVYGEDYGATDMQAEIFDNSGSAAKKRKRLASQERAAFGGSAGVTSIAQNRAGDY